MSEVNANAAAQQEEVTAQEALLAEPVVETETDSEDGADESAPEEVSAAKSNGKDKIGDKLLAKAIGAYKRANREHTISRVECGFYCQQYILHRRFTLKQDRKLAVKALEGELAQVAESVDDADVSRLVAIWAVVSLLSTGRQDGKRRDEPWHHLAWGKLCAMQGLVFRNDETDEWSVKPGVNLEKAKDVMTYALGQDGQQPSRADILTAAMSLFNPQKLAEQQAKKAIAAKKATESAASSEEPRPQATAVSAQDAEADDEEDQEEEDGAEDAPEDVAERLVSEARSERETIHKNLLASAGLATPKDSAWFLVDYLYGTEAPDDVFEEMLALILKHKDVSRTLARACRAAAVILQRNDSPAPVQVAEALAAKDGSANGVPVTV